MKAFFHSKYNNIHWNYEKKICIFLSPHLALNDLNCFGAYKVKDV